MDNKLYNSLPEEELRTIARQVKNHVLGTASNESNSDHTFKLQNLLERVYSTASRSDLSTTRNVASWNCLCALIDQSLISPSVSTRHVILQSDILSRCCELYLVQGTHVRPKSAKQLLTTIGNAMKKYNDYSNIQLLRQALVHSLRCNLLDGAKNRHVKSSLLMLSHLLAKGILTIEEFSNPLTTNSVQSAASDRLSSTEVNFDLYEVLIGLATNGEHASSIGQLLSTMLSPQIKATIEEQSARSPKWSGPLKKAFTKSPGDIDKLATYILPVLFKQNTIEVTAFLKDLGWNNENGVSINSRYELLLCASLVTSNTIGVLAHVDEVTMEANQPGRISVSYHQIESLLEESSTACRMTGLTLLVASPAMTRPFKQHTLKLLQKHLQHLHADTDADFRGELFGITTKLFDRLRAATALLERQSRSANKPDAVTSINSLQIHQSFMWWYLKFLNWELRPSASYQRHICATRCISIAIKSGIDGRVPYEKLSKNAQGPTRWPFELYIMHGTLMQLLLDLLMDPFEDVRQAASSCLSMYSDINTRPDGADSDIYASALQKAERRMLASGRADHCDGTAHLNAQLALQEAKDLTKHQPPLTGRTLNQLVQKLYEALNIAKADLSIAVKSYPLHGLLTSVRYILTTGTTTQTITTSAVQQLLPLIQDVWLVVRAVLCDDAPEGYLPESSTDTLLASTKDILSFSWRALKEASLLTGIIVMLLPTLQLDECSRRKYKNSLSALTFTQLAELRHRGAFSTVAQTWTTCCTQSKQSSNSATSSECLAWYEQVLVLLRDKVTINTRRSAGLPALLCGILVADSNGDLVRRAVSDLEVISRSPVEAKLAHEGSLPQVHAMNCIKDILKNSKLSEHSERYITPALRLAADSLLSQAWAIRNCGLMLFRAVIDRMVGTNDPFAEEESLQKFDIFEQHSELLETIISLLQPRVSGAGIGAQRGEAVFPALQLLQRSQVSEGKMLDVQVAVLELTYNSSWHIRVMAARTYAALTKLEETRDEFSFILSLSSTNHQNGLHGALLCAKYLVRKQIQFVRNLSLSNCDRLKWLEVAHKQVMNVLERRAFYDNNSCGFTKAAWINLLRESQHLVHVAHSPLITQELLVFDTVEHCSFDALAELRSKLENDADRDLSVFPLRQALAAAASESFPNTLSDEVQLLRIYSDLASKDIDAFSTSFSAQGHLHLQEAEVESLILKLLEEKGLPSAGKVCLRSYLLVTLKDCDDRQKFFRRLPITNLLTNNVPTPHDMMILVELQALLIESNAAISRDIDDHLRQWVGACELILRDPLDHTREAIARGLTHFDHTFTYLKREAAKEEILRSLMVMIYDLLNDDDEDVRLLASKVAGRITRESGPLDHTFSPIVASQKLIGSMVRRWYQSSDFTVEAFSRAFGIRRSHTVSFGESVHKVAQDDSVLFAEEKQNLYIDEAREAKVWGQVIMRTDARVIKTKAIIELAMWTSEGLDFFLQEAEQGLRLYEHSHEADIFTLVLRLFYGVEVLLWCVNNRLKLPCRPSVLLTKLHKIAEGLEQREMGNLWVSEAKRILNSAVVVRLRSMRQLMKCVVKG